MQPLWIQRWKTLEPLIDAALNSPAERRREYLDAACGADVALRSELELLLTGCDNPHPLLDSPVVANFTSLFDDETRPPDVLAGRYRIGDEIGRGGMATVYVADDIRHERRVAVKVLNHQVAEALGADLFLAEIKTTARLQHQHILPLHDSGEAEGLLFYVMPYVAGDTLRRKLEREHQLPVDAALRIALQVASALEAAHRLGVIHRDIKPENILLQDDTVLVADFGIALSTSGTAGVARRSLTLGTPRYVSPEQASGQSIPDSRTDLYSLGVVLYEMLAGDPPSDTGAALTAGDGEVDIAAALCSARADIPPPLARVIARTLNRNPAERYQSVGEFAAALTQSAKQATPTDVDRPAPTHVRRQRAWAATLVVFAVAAGVIAVELLGKRASSGDVRRPTRNLQALDLYNQGRTLLDKRTLVEVKLAEGYFNQAIAMDSGFADAYSGLSDVYTYYVIGNATDSLPPAETFARARKAAQLALLLDGTSGKAHASLGGVKLLYDFDWDGSTRELSRALELDPTASVAHVFHISLLQFTQRFDEAIIEAGELSRKDPLSMYASTELGRAYFFGGRYDDAREQLRHVLERDSTQSRAHLLLGEVLEREGMFMEAVEEMRAAVRHAPSGSRPRAFLAHALASAGRISDAQRELDSLQQRARSRYVPAFDFAVVYAGLGRADEAFEWLNKAYDERSIRPYLLDPTFDPIRADPRFQKLLIKLRLPLGVTPR